MGMVRKQRNQDSFFRRLMVLVTWEVFLRMLGLVEVFLYTSLNFQTTEEKQYGH